MPIEYVKTVNVEYTSVEVEYLEWAGRTIEELKQQNADLLDALKATQDCAKMAALAVDIRMTLNPGKAVEYFNSIFPEVARAIARIEGE